MPKQISDIKEFISLAGRKGASAARLKRKTVRLPDGKLKTQTKFKLRCARYLYTLTLDDDEKSDKLQASLPPGTTIEEVPKATKKK